MANAECNGRMFQNICFIMPGIVSQSRNCSHKCTIKAPFISREIILGRDFSKDLEQQKMLDLEQNQCHENFVDYDCTDLDTPIHRQ